MDEALVAQLAALVDDHGTDGVIAGLLEAVMNHLPDGPYPKNWAIGLIQGSLTDAERNA